ncbi:regulator [Yokenella regensburgei]|uniref:regulator n=1 Tax=Yokenella regensburgei TaxID=158877 RepID=UPI003F14C3E3
MKKCPFYRRPGKKGKFTGLKERVIWMIQTRGAPVTGAEIAEKFGITLIEFNRTANTLTRGDGQIVKVIASPTWKTETGIVDRHFSIESQPKLLSPSGKEKTFTRKGKDQAARNQQKECIARAARRARLIAAGLYIDEFEDVL